MERSREKALEAYLVQAAKLGERRAVERLFRLRGPRLYAHAVRLLGDAEAARDLTQEAWIEILRGIRGLRDDTAFLPWALRIVSRRVAREIRRRQKARQLERDWRDEVEAHAPEEGPGRVDGARVRAALARLSPAHRATVALFYLEDFTTAEAAVALDVPVGTVKSRLMHARARLREILEGEKDGKD